MYRDTGWYHLVVAVDSPTETANDRFKIYVNDEQITALANGNTNPSLDKESYVNDSNNPHYLGYIGADGYDLDAYLSQAYFIDGKVLDPSYFGFTDPLTNTWRPKKFDIRTEVKKNLNDGTTWSNFLTTNAGDNFDGSGEQKLLMVMDPIKHIQQTIVMAPHKIHHILKWFSQLLSVGH